MENGLRNCVGTLLITGMKGIQCSSYMLTDRVLNEERYTSPVIYSQTRFTLYSQTLFLSAKLCK